jgi:hypothetical protein
MSLQQRHRQRNLNLTFQTTVETRLIAINAAYATRMFFNDTLADPTALDGRLSALGFWVNLRYVRGGVGLKQPTLYQIDCYSAVGTIVSPSDRYAEESVEVADDVIASMATADRGVLIKDYSVTPLAPTTTIEWYLVRNPAGQQGWPAERVQIPNDRGLLIECLTFHIWHHQDLHPGQQIYF